jgi:hypothetical protein
VASATPDWAKEQTPRFGEQNRVGLLEFNFGMNRLTGDGAQQAGGKGAIRCETGRFDLLLLGTGIVE